MDRREFLETQQKQHAAWEKLLVYRPLVVVTGLQMHLHRVGRLVLTTMESFENELLSLAGSQWLEQLAKRFDVELRLQIDRS